MKECSIILKKKCNLLNLKKKGDQAHMSNKGNNFWILSYNVYGLKNEINNPDFLEYILDYEIIHLFKRHVIELNTNTYSFDFEVK